jgi:hypothetical protein
MQCSFAAAAAWTETLGENVSPDGIHVGGDFPGEDAGEIPEMRFEMDTAGKEELTGV